MVKLFICGDVMTGRGIDQIMPNPCQPHLYESCIKDARQYIHLSPYQPPLDAFENYSYIWGDALEAAAHESVDFRIVNLETSVTTSEQAWPDKPIHYRMNPKNIGCLTAMKIDCCTLANNHVLDWGYSGLEETLASLKSAGIKTCGVGKNLQEASAPVVLENQDSKVLVFAYGVYSSGIPVSWAATELKAGVNWLLDLSSESTTKVIKEVKTHRVKHEREEPHKTIYTLVSIHWGPNWQLELDGDEHDFALNLADAGVDIIMGHSSHHVKAYGRYKNSAILFGCGDFINDYEGIGGHEDRYHSDLTNAYIITLNGPGQEVNIKTIPFKRRAFTLHHASPSDAKLLQQFNLHDIKPQ